MPGTAFEAKYDPYGWARANILWVDHADGGRSQPFQGEVYVAPGKLYDANHTMLPGFWSIRVRICDAAVQAVVSEGQELLEATSTFQLFEGPRRTLVGNILRD
jgi:hypothetical protein